MNKVFKVAIVQIALLILSGCSKEAVKPSIETMPETRPFYMGFTGFPYDLTSAALQETYKKVNENGDIYLNHLDHGVPWDEALNGLPFPMEVQQTLHEAVDAIKPGNKFFLTATSTSQTRNTIANYWNDQGTHQPLPVKWQDKKFDDPEVIEAYVNYCKRIIDFSDPDYFAYGIEINASFQENSDDFSAYLKFAETVYKELKNTYPVLPIMLTFQDQSFENSKKDLLDLTSKLLPYTDYIAMSTYPFWQYPYPTRDANPKLFDANWLDDFRKLDLNKPFAISETGFCAEDLIMDDYGVHIKGSEDWQKDYLEKLFRHADQLKTEFIMWFVYRDYDKLYDKYYTGDNFTKIWRDSGLLDGMGHERPAFEVWREWKKKEKE